MSGNVVKLCPYLQNTAHLKGAANKKRNLSEYDEIHSGFVFWQFYWARKGLKYQKVLKEIKAPRGNIFQFKPIFGADPVFTAFLMQLILLFIVVNWVHQLESFDRPTTRIPIFGWFFENLEFGLDFVSRNDSGWHTQDVIFF